MLLGVRFVLLALPVLVVAAFFAALKSYRSRARPTPASCGSFGKG
jgi:hypothetical protein